MSAERSAITERVALALRIVCALTACVAFAWFVFHQIRAIGFPFPVDYGEGPLLEQARLLAHGQNIYHANLQDYPFTISNYPPVFPALLSIGVRLFGPSYSIGRTLTFLAAFACVFHIASIVMRHQPNMAKNRFAAFVAAGVFVSTPYVVFWTTLLRIDLVALAFSLGAVAFVSARPTQRFTPFIAALIAMLAVMTRQSHALAAPLAITCALATQSWKRAAQFVGALGVGLVLCVAALELTTRGFLFDTVTANANAFLWPLFWIFARDIAIMLGALIVLSIVAMAMRPDWNRFQSRLVIAYFIGAILSATTIGKVGSNVNYLLELVAAVSITTGIAIARFSRDWRSSAASSVVVALSILWLVRDAWLRTNGVDDKLRLRAQYTELTKLIAAEPKPVIADEAMGLIVLTDHPLMLQPFEMTQLSHQHLWNQKPLLDDIHQKKFGLVLINDTKATPEAWTRERWTEEMLSEIHASYIADGELADATIYRPRHDD